MEKYEILIGDATETLRTLPDQSVDSIVTDPPYGLSKAPDLPGLFCYWGWGLCVIRAPSPPPSG